MKIMVVLGEYPPDEEEIRRKAVQACASPGTEIGFSVIKWESFGRASVELSALVRGPLVVEKAKEAASQGYDAVVVLGSLDLGVEAARHEVDIPVVGAGRTSYHVAAMLTHRVGVIVYEDKTIPYSWNMIRAFGVQRFITSVRAVNVPIRNMMAQRELMKSRFIALGRRAVEEEDAELIFPQGISMVPVHCSAEEISKEVGVPVLDGVAISVKTAEMMAAMGLRNSRKAYPAP